jgi:hypothetical protein
MMHSRVLSMLVVAVGATLAATACAPTAKVVDVSLHTQSFPTEPKINALAQSTVADIQATNQPGNPLGTPHVANVTTTVLLPYKVSDTARSFLEGLTNVRVSFTDNDTTVRMFYRENVDEVDINTFHYALKSPLSFLQMQKNATLTGVMILPAPSLLEKLVHKIKITRIGDQGNSQVSEPKEGQRTTVSWFARVDNPWDIIYKLT